MKKLISVLVFFLLVGEASAEDFQLWRLNKIGEQPAECPQEIYLSEGDLAILTYQCPQLYYYWTGVRYKILGRSESVLNIVFDINTYRECAQPAKANWSSASPLPYMFRLNGNGMMIEEHYCQNGICGQDGHFLNVSMFQLFENTPPAIEIAPGKYEPREDCRLPKNLPQTVIP